MSAFSSLYPYANFTLTEEAGPDAARPPGRKKAKPARAAGPPSFVLSFGVVCGMGRVLFFSGCLSAEDLPTL
jgi:hypothetical protein